MVAVVAACGGIVAGVFATLFLVQSQSAATTGTAVRAETLQRRPAPSFTLVDQNGAPVSLASARGKVVLLTFMDPQCRTLCPVMGRDIGAVERKLPASLHPELLIVSVAPGRTLADVNTYIATQSPGWRAGWHWLLGPDARALQLAWSRWQITVIPTSGDVTHDEVLELIDPQGSLRATFPAPLPVDDVAHDITTIAHA